MKSSFRTAVSGLAGKERAYADAAVFLSAGSPSVDAVRLADHRHRRGADLAGLPAHGRSRRGQRERAGRAIGGRGEPGGRSEEHTSELQSLMRISYAVFCLKKKNKSNKN